MIHQIGILQSSNTRSFYNVFWDVNTKYVYISAYGSKSTPLKVGNANTVESALRKVEEYFYMNGEK